MSRPTAREVYEYLIRSRGIKPLVKSVSAKLNLNRETQMVAMSYGIIIVIFNGPSNDIYPISPDSLQT